MLVVANLFQFYPQFYPVMQRVAMCEVFFLIQGLQVIDQVTLTFDHACKEHIKIKKKN